MSIPFVTTLTPLSHFPQSATFLSASQQLPLPQEFFLEGAQVLRVLVSLFSLIPLPRAKPDQDCRKGHKQNGVLGWAPGGVGAGQVGAGRSQRLQPTTALHLSPNSTPNTPRLPSLPCPHLTFWGSLCLTTRKHSSPSWGPGPACAYLSDSAHACSQWSGRRNNELVQYNRKLVW